MFCSIVFFTNLYNVSEIKEINQIFLRIKVYIYTCGASTPARSARQPPLATVTTIQINGGAGCWFHEETTSQYISLIERFILHRAKYKGRTPLTVLPLRQ